MLNNRITRMAKVFIVSSLSVLPLGSTTLAKKVPARASWLSKEIKALNHNISSADVFTPQYYSKNVYLENGKKLTVKKILNDANAIAKSIKAQKMRPVPVLDKNGKITAFVKVFAPKKRGRLSGKTILVNAGHGGYNPSNGFFDLGTFAKDSKNKRIEEWYKNQNFALSLIHNLTEKGAKVIYLQGHVKSIVKLKRKFANAQVFISIHCDALPSSMSGPTIKFKDDNDKNLAKVVNKALKKWVFSCKVDEQPRNLAVLRERTKMPSILIETGNMANKNDLKRIDSQTSRDLFGEKLAEGIVNFFKK